MSYHPADPKADALAVEFRDALLAACRKQRRSSKRELNAYCARLDELMFTPAQLHAAVRVVEADVVLLLRADSD